MKYYLDTEFIEGFHKPLFGKKRHFIDLISIGIVGEDGSQFYAISREYDYNKADKWVKDNVILPLYLETVHGDNRNRFDVHNFHKHYGRSNKEIMCDIILYIYRDQYKHWMDSTSEFIERGIKYGWGEDLSHELYAYYADYDWVVFCSLFGRMIDLPKGFPMYCRDLKQMLDEKIESLHIKLGGLGDKVTALGSLDEHKERWKTHPDYPKQANEHNALDDAKWNKKLHEFITQVLAK